MPHATQPLTGVNQDAARDLAAGMMGGSATAHERIAIPDESSAPSALAAHSSVVLVAHGDRLYVLENVGRLRGAAS